MDRHICIVGGSATLASPLISHFIELGDEVTILCRGDGIAPVSNHLKVFNDIDMATSDAEILDELSPIDVLITLMGTVRNNRLEYISEIEWDTVIRDNLYSVRNALKYSSKRLLENSNVVVVGSIVASIGGYGCSNYATAKAGLVGLVRAASNEWCSRGICINLLELGYIEAGMGARIVPGIREKIISTIPLKRFGSVEDFVLAIDFLANTKYMSGNMLTLAGGLR